MELCLAQTPTNPTLPPHWTRSARTRLDIIRDSSAVVNQAQTGAVRLQPMPLGTVAFAEVPLLSHRLEPVPDATLPAPRRCLLSYSLSWDVYGLQRRGAAMEARAVCFRSGHSHQHTQRLRDPPRERQQMFAQGVRCRSALCCAHWHRTFFSESANQVIYVIERQATGNGKTVATMKRT